MSLRSMLKTAFSSLRIQMLQPFLQSTDILAELTAVETVERPGSPSTSEAPSSPVDGGAELV